MNEQNPPLRGRLFYLQLGSPAPERLARFYGHVFGMTVQQSAGGWICRGPDRCLAFHQGQPGTLLSAGYAAADAQTLWSLAARAATSLVDTAAIDSELFEPGAVALRDPDGNRIVYGLPPVSSDSALGVDAPPARLQHVVVGSVDVTRMAAFYTDVVGLRASDEVRDDDGDTRACFLRSDDEHHSFAVFRTPKNRLDHHCYELPDWNAIRDWGDRLAARQVAIKWGPGRHGPGNNLFIFFHDPDGNWVELSTELERVPAERLTGTWRHEERTLNSWGRAYLRS
jgi:catechol 2,3-dioxygenase-like lactoylglutathione lyase family enzyme